MSIIKYNLEKAKEQAHEYRRNKRKKLYYEVDGNNQLISLNKKGENIRNKIKDEDDKLQKDIDSQCLDLKNNSNNGLVEIEEFFNIDKKLKKYGCL